MSLHLRVFRPASGLAVITDSDEEIANDTLRKALDLKKLTMLFLYASLQARPLTKFGNNIILFWHDRFVFDRNLSSNFTKQDECRAITSNCQQTPAIPVFTCHRQGVERLIKEVTRASAIVSDRKSLQRLIVSSVKSKKNFQNRTVNKILYNALTTIFFLCFYVDFEQLLLQRLLLFLSWSALLVVTVAAFR